MTPPHSTAVMQEHLIGLSEQLKCDLFMEQDTSGMMWVEFGWVEGPSIVYGGRAYPDVSSRYYTNLHELGHYAHGHTQGRPYTSKGYRGRVVEHPNGHQWYFDNGVLKSEAEAWEWAMNEALYPPTEACRRFMHTTCIGSYYQSSLGGGRVFLGNGDRDYVVAIWDKPDRYFHRIRERMLKEGI